MMSNLNVFLESKPLLATLKKNISLLKTTLLRKSRTGLNSLRYGKNSTVFGELIYVNPNELVNHTRAWHRNHSGCIRAGDWDIKELHPIDELFKISCCKKHWMDNVPWEETGIYDFMLAIIKEKNRPADGCQSLEDIIARYNRLDQLFEEVKRTGAFKTQKQLNPSAENEQGGIYVHIGRDNKLIFGGGGFHRLAIAQILNLKSIPAQLGVVHPFSIKTWKQYKTPQN